LVSQVHANGLSGRREPFQLAGELGGDRQVGLGRHRGGLVDEERASFVAAGDDVGVEGQRPEERNADLAAHPFAAAAAEDVGALAAVRAGERAHVLDDPEDGDVHRLEHP
jgi:hypothetical protein